VRLHYGSAQTLVGIVFLVIVLALAVVFAVIAAHAGEEVSQDRVQAIGYWIRKRWLALLTGLLVVVVGASWASLPYASGSRIGRTVVRVAAGQFFWTFTPPSVPAGTPVRFEVVSRDVNHGFGLYNPDGELIGEVQAMPGYTNLLDLTLNRPGQYRVLCLEYCGIGHHQMTGVLTVLPVRR
jgi:cytochrome c oxidase subunit 2